MDCTEARQLVNQGITPGSTSPIKAQLGFHLATCAACRGYFEHYVPQPTAPVPKQPTSTTSQEQKRAATIRERLPLQQPPLNVHDASFITKKEPSEEPVQQLLPNERGSVLSPLLNMQTKRFLWLTVIAFLVITPLSAMLWFANMLFQTHQNISAMVVSTPVPPIATPFSSNTPLAGPPPTPIPTTLPPMPTIPAAGESSPITQPLKMQLPPLGIPTQTDSSLAFAKKHQNQPQKHKVKAYNTPITTLLPAVAATPWPTIQSLLPTPPPTPVRVGMVHASEQSPIEVGQARTILLLGTDRRPGEREVPRTDAIIVLRADPQNKRIAMLSLPRDLWVTIPNYGASRINAAYVWGEIYQATGGGMGLASRTISNLLNLTIDYVITVDFEGFIGLIDQLGGVTVNVEKELYDPSFPTMDYGYTVAHFLPGPQHMDGNTALMYSRIRHPDSDFVRTQRQQTVLTAIGERLRERGDLQNVMTIDKISGVLRNYVKTDMQEDRIIGLVWALSHIDSQRVERYSITSDMVTWGVGSDSYALAVPPDVLNDLAKKLLGEKR